MRNFTTIKERILYFIENQGINITKFYLESGVSYGILTQKSKITEDNIVKFLTKYKNVNPEWLLIGKGEMLKQNDNNNIGNGQQIIANNIDGDINADNRQYYSDSPEVLKAQIDDKDKLLKEKDERIREKDERIREKDAYIAELKEIIRELKSV
jgi:hypothetical protein